MGQREGQARTAMPQPKVDDRDDVYSGLSTSARKRAHSRERAYRSKAADVEALLASPSDDRRFLTCSAALILPLAVMFPGRAR